MLIDVFVFILFPLATTMVVYWRVRKHKLRWLITLITALIAARICYSFGMFFLYPNADYENTYEKVTGMEYPHNGSVIFTQNWSHGAYQGNSDLAFILKCDTMQVDSIRRSMVIHRGFDVVKVPLESDKDWVYYIQTGLNENNLTLSNAYGYYKNGMKYFVGVTADRRHVVFFRRGD